ncbi:MAG: hypothetical protein WC700_09040 [Gemmatimonadaceae bacterium]
MKDQAKEAARAERTRLAAKVKREAAKAQRDADPFGLVDTLAPAAPAPEPEPAHAPEPEIEPDTPMTWRDSHDALVRDVQAEQDRVVLDALNAAAPAPGFAPGFSAEDIEAAAERQREAARERALADEARVRAAEVPDAVYEEMPLIAAALVGIPFGTVPDAAADVVVFDRLPLERGTAHVREDVPPETNTAAQIAHLDLMIHDDPERTVLLARLAQLETHQLRAALNAGLLHRGPAVMPLTLTQFSVDDAPSAPAADAPNVLCFREGKFRVAKGGFVADPGHYRFHLRTGAVVDETAYRPGTFTRWEREGIVLEPVEG